MALSQRRARVIERLRARRTRERDRLVLVEGVRAVSEALAAGAETRFAVTSPRLGATGAGAALRARLADVETTETTDEELRSVADTVSPQGVLLVCREPEAPGGWEGGGRLLVLDGVQDPGNVGTLVRGAVAFAIDGVVCLDGTVDPWGAKSVRASAGSVFRTRLARTSAEDTLARLAELDVPLLVADAAGEDARAFRGLSRFALVIGNEGAGVREELRAAAHATVGVPLPGPSESLNAGVAGSILMHTLTEEGELG